MLATFLIGFREGLEAALIVGILIAYARKCERPDVVRRIWFGVGFAILLSLITGCILTYGAYGLSFKAQEIIGGTLSLIAVAMVTSMIFWMLRTAKTLATELQGKLATQMITGSAWGIVALATVSVGREGLETALFIWATTKTFELGPLAGFASAVAGIAVAALLGWALQAGLVRINLSRFFRWSGLLLIIFTAGILAYAIHDLQEADVLPGPFALPPGWAPTALHGLWGENAWAFQIGHIIAPDGLLGSLLKGTIGFSPEMTKLEIFGWLLYLSITLTVFIVLQKRPAKPSVAAAATRCVVEARNPNHTSNKKQLVGGGTTNASFERTAVERY
ncbi:iron uptake transporter permease EfeU [Canibacter zhoujuaniae]|uniref:iron uptake transporter permease EfeU n=1 Tax=Canibacter zhoujuaniae TaxID=2708343 RepID=UPI001423EEA4|nr:iron uptake transporter permease EfeU [Canibacter zhoujuaniae]